MAGNQSTGAIDPLSLSLMPAILTSSPPITNIRAESTCTSGTAGAIWTLSVWKCSEMGGAPQCINSFAHVNTTEKITMMDPREFAFFLDSGAFSAWTRGTAIDLDEYCAFIRANIDYIEVYASLDVIPGKHGGIATPRERDEAAEGSWRNYLYMRAEGLSPLPVYHYGEDMRFLERMLDYGCDYIGIGGLVGVSSPARREWLDRVFLRLCNKEGVPVVKTHGFGMTSIPLIFRYPWYSVDSTAWIKFASHGSIPLPMVRDGEFIFDQAPETVYVSNNGSKTTGNNAHAGMFSAGKRAILDRWLKECGKTYSEVREHYYHRAVVAVTFFKRVSEAKLNTTFRLDRPQKQSLFVDHDE